MTSPRFVVSSIGREPPGQRAKPRRWWTWVVLAAAAVAALWLLTGLGPVMRPFWLGLAITYLLAPPVRNLVRRGLRPAAAILLIYAVLALALAGVVGGVLPSAVAESQRALTNLPGYLSGLEDWLAQTDRSMAQRWPDAARDFVRAAVARLSERLRGAVEAVVAGLMGFVANLWVIVLAPVVAYYLLRDLDRWTEAAVVLVPAAWRAEWLGLLSQMDAVVGGFLRGQVILGLIVGIVSGFVAALFGLPFAVLLGLLAGVFELIPYVGPILGALPAVSLALADSPWRAAQVAVAFAIIQQVEGAWLSPLVLGQTVGLHPLVVLFAILAGGYLGGVFGMVLAVPAVGSLQVLARHLLRMATET